MQSSMTAPRVKRPLEDEDFIKRLTVEDDAPFTTIRDLLVYCAALAFNRKAEPHRFEKTAEPVPFQIFESAQLDKFIDILALVVSKDHNILTEERLPERIEIFERFAASGVKILRQALDAAKGRSALDVLRDLTLDEFRKREGHVATNLEHLLSELDS
jgi:dnd system-associated protein 4